MATDRALVRQAFYDRIESDNTFFQYFGDLTEEEIQEIADERANTYINEAIIILTRKCEPEIDFSIDVESDSFTSDLTDEEILLIGSDLAFEAYIARDVAKLKSRVNTFASSDLKPIFSSANERKSFMEMFEQLQRDNRSKISDYSARDRITGKFHSVNSLGV